MGWPGHWQLPTHRMHNQFPWGCLMSASCPGGPQPRHLQQVVDRLGLVGEQLPDTAATQRGGHGRRQRRRWRRVRRSPRRQPLAVHCLSAVPGQALEVGKEGLCAEGGGVGAGGVLLQQLWGPG